MIIGITTGFIKGEEGIPENGDAHYNVISQLAAQHPEHRFQLFYARAAENFQAGLPPNVVLQKKPDGTHPLLQKFWYDVHLGRLLKKYKVDVLFSMEGYSSNTAQVPQCLLMPGSFSANSLQKGKPAGQQMYHWLLRRFRSKAGSIIVGSERQKQQLENLDGRWGDKIEVVYGGASAPNDMLSAEVKAQVRQQHTEGMEYFIYEGPVRSQHVLPVLKAFSLFKKRQQTSWKLVLSGVEVGAEKGFAQLMGSYKYRQDVILAGSLNEVERSGLQGAAYGAIDTYADHHTISPALAWMRRGVPYIAVKGNPLGEISTDAALFFTSDEPAEIAEKLMQLYKDEALHAALTEKGLALAKVYNWQRTADQIWKNLVGLHKSQQ